MIQKTDSLILARNTLRPGLAPEMFRSFAADQVASRTRASPVQRSNGLSPTPALSRISRRTSIRNCAGSRGFCGDGRRACQRNACADSIQSWRRGRPPTSVLSGEVSENRNRRQNRGCCRLLVGLHSAGSREEPLRPTAIQRLPVLSHSGPRQVRGYRRAAPSSLEKDAVHER